VPNTTIYPDLDLDFVQSRRTQSAPLREEYLSICGNDWVIAVILNQAVYKVARVLDAKAELAERAAHMQHDLDAVAAQRLIEGDWFPFTVAQWQNLCMCKRDESVFRRHLNKLVEHGFLEKRTNERYKNGVLDYRVRIDTITKALLANGYIMPQEEFKWYSLWLVQQERAARNPMPVATAPAQQQTMDVAGTQKRQNLGTPVSEKHPASKHPFVQSYRSLMQKNPNTPAAEAIAERYPMPTNEDVKAWEAHLVWWISLNNYNPVGFADMMDSFDERHAFERGDSEYVRSVPNGGWTLWNPNMVIDRYGFEDWAELKHDPDWNHPDWQAQRESVRPLLLGVVRARQTLNLEVSEFLLERLRMTKPDLYRDESFDIQRWMIANKFQWRDQHEDDAQKMQLWAQAERQLGAKELPSFAAFKASLKPIQPVTRPSAFGLDDIDEIPF